MIKTRAIVLHRFAYSDSSFIVKALTEECGVVSFIIKGAKRKESPFKGALDPLALSEAVFRQNPAKELQFIKEASIVNWHAHLRASLMDLAIAQVMAEIVLRYAPPGTPIPEEFALLEQALANLDAPVDAPGKTCADMVFSRWLLDICDLWGYHLDLGMCSRCEKPLTEPAADFSPESGALICKHCLGVQSARARQETLQGLWELHLQEIHPNPVQNLSGRVFVENALLSYLRNHIGFLKEIHSLSWLQEVRKLCSAPST
jgi:DNA repair protein RecO (recombination protein O)